MSALAGEPRHHYERPFCPVCRGAHPLTARQDEVLALLAEGWDNEGVGQRMKPPLQKGSVENHVNHAFSALPLPLHGVDRRVAAVLWFQAHEQREHGICGVTASWLPFDASLPWMVE